MVVSDLPLAHEIPAAFAADRYCAICGSAAEMGVQPWAVTIFPLLGVTV